MHVPLFPGGSIRNLYPAPSAGIASLKSSHFPAATGAFTEFSSFARVGIQAADANSRLGETQIAASARGQFDRQLNFGLSYLFGYSFQRQMGSH